jgi:hypothetical protein
MTEKIPVAGDNEQNLRRQSTRHDPEELEAAAGPTGLKLVLSREQS